MNRRAFFAWLWEMGVFVSLSRYLPWLKSAPAERLPQYATFGNFTYPEEWLDAEPTIPILGEKWTGKITGDVSLRNGMSHYTAAILCDDNDGPIAFWWIVGPDESSPEELNAYQTKKIQDGGDE